MTASLRFTPLLGLALLLAGCPAPQSSGPADNATAPAGTAPVKIAAEEFPPAPPNAVAPLDLASETPAEFGPTLTPAAVEYMRTFKHPRTGEPFFRLASPSEIPVDLRWVDGLEDAEFASPQAKRGGTFNYFIPSYPPTLRTLGPDGNSAFRSYILDDNAVGLFKMHPNTARYYPGVASLKAMSKDRKTFYYRLNPKARFSNGDAVTADDFLFMFYFMQSANINDPWYNNWYTDEYNAITKFDAHTLAITIPNERPDPWDRTDELVPRPAKFYRDNGFGPTWTKDYQWRFEPTTGAYGVLDEANDLKEGVSVTIRRVPDWWAGDLKYWRYRFNPDAIRFLIISDLNAAYQSFLKGDLDLFPAALAEYWYEKSADEAAFAKGYIARSTFYNDRPRPSWGLSLNTSHPLLANRDVRLGLNYAMNFEKVIQAFWRGDYERMTNNADGYGEFSGPVRARPFSPRDARAAFARAGFTERDRDGYLQDAQGRRLSFDLLFSLAQMEPAMNILAEEAKKSGVELRINRQDSTAVFQKIRQKKHEITFGAWSRTSLVYPRYWEEWHSVNAYNPDGTPKENTNNVTLTANPALDKLIEQYDRESDPAKIKEIGFQIQQMIHDEAAWIPGWKRPWFRQFHWRWVGFPAAFNVRLADTADEQYLFWVDEDRKRETEAAMREGRTFPPQNLVFDQFRVR